MRSTLGRNALILLMNNAGGAVLAFFISVLIGRQLGAAGLGQYAFIIAWVTPLTMLADFGLGTLITRDVARDPANAPRILHTANQALPLFATILLIAAWLVLRLSDLSPIISSGIALAALLILLDPWYGLYTALFRAFERMTPILVVNVGGLALQLILSSLALRQNAGLIGVIGVLIAVNVGQLALIWIWWRRSGCQTPYLPDSAPPIRTLIRRASPFALAAVIGALGVRLNVLLLEHLSGDVAVGWYSAASRFVEAGRLLPNAFFGALFPALSALAARPDALIALFRRAALLLGALSVLLAACLTATAPLLLRLAYRDSFESAVPTLILLAWSLIPSVLHALVNVYFYSRGREGQVNRVSLGALIAQVGIGWLCISAWGAPGAALSVIVVEVGALIGLWLTARLSMTSGQST